MALSCGKLAGLLVAVGVLLCAVGQSSSRPSSDVSSTNDASSHGFLIAASLTAVATICLVVALAVCTCCDGYEQFPGLSTNRQQTSGQTTSNLFAPASTTESANVSVTIEPLPEVTNLRPAKVTPPPPKVTPAPPPNNIVSSQQNVTRKDWETFDDRASEQQQMQPMAAPQISSNVHDIMDDQGLPYSPIGQKKGPLLQHQMKPLNSTSTPDDDTKQPVIIQQRMSSRAPPPLMLDDEVLIAPIATPALREAYNRNRSAVLQLSDEDIRAIPPSEREERVYQFLTPEEIWSLEGRIAATASPAKHKPSIAPLDVSESHVLTESAEHAVALSTLSDEHESKRKQLLDLPDAQLAQMPLAEIESYFPHLTAVEILGVQERVKRLQSIQDPSYRSDNNSTRHHSALSAASRSYLRSLHSTLSVRGDESGFYIEDDILSDEAQQQSAMEVREMLLNANVDSLIEIDSDLLSKAFVYLTPEEFADTQQHLMLAKESKRAQLLAASGAELRSLPAARFEAWMAMLEPNEAVAVRARMAEVDDVDRSRTESSSSLDASNTAAAGDALKVDYDVKANWRLTPNLSLSSSPDPTTQHFDFTSGEPPIVQVSQSEPLISPVEEEHEVKTVSHEESLTEEGARSNETTPTPTAEQSLMEDLVQLESTERDGVFEPSPHVPSQSGALNHVSALDDLELFLSEEAPGSHSVTDVGHESAQYNLEPVDTIETLNVQKTDDVRTATPVEEMVVGDLIDQVLSSVGAELHMATHRPHSPESSL